MLDIPLPNGYTQHESGKFIVPIQKDISREIEITISGNNDFALFEKVSEKISAIKNSESKPRILKIKLFSLGGDVYAGFAIHELLQVYSKESNVGVQTECYGAAMSMACLILQSGDKRVMSTNSTLLLHSFSIKREGPVNMVISEGKQIEAMNDLYASLVSKRVKQSGGVLKKEDILDMIHSEHESGTYLTADSALKHKLIDEII